MHKFRATLSIMLLLGLTPIGFAEGLPDLGDASQVDLSPQAEQRVGEKIMQDIRLNEPTYIADAEINGYINRIGHKLAAKLESPGQSFEFFVLRDSTLNAFAMPGGYIGVHSGLILAAQSESELASVLGHEISHVTQHHMARMVSKQNQAQIPTMVAMALALLASRSRSDLGMGGVMAAQGAAIQSQLNYGRDFEREADRLGLQLLQKGGYDVRGMEAFFERLQKASRLYENNAPAYLMTHPLTTERIADMGNRAHGMPYKQVRDSLDFVLIRAKLRAMEASPRDAVANAEAQLRERRFSSEIAMRYTLAYAYLRAGNHVSATRELNELRRLKVVSPMVETLAAEIRQKQGDPVGAEKLLRAAYQRNPQDRALSYALIDNLTNSKQYAEAVRMTASELASYPSDFRLYEAQAKAYAGQGKQLLQHRAQAEVYALQGQLPQAIEQLLLAQKAPDGNFYEYSQVDSRLRELKQKKADEAKKPK